MSKLLPRWFAALLAFSVAVVIYGTMEMSWHQNSQPRINPAKLYDTIWLDKYPEMSHEPWKAYIFTSDNVGIHIDAASSFKLTLELFEFKADNSKLRFHFPHDGRRAHSSYRIEKLKKPTRHFDTKLVIEQDPQNGGQLKEYYTGPEFRSKQNLPEPFKSYLKAINK